MNILNGTFVPAVTPFGPSGDLLLGAIAKNMERWCSSGVAGVMALGSNGEARSVTDREALDVLRVFADCKREKVLIAGVGRESTYATLRFLEDVMRVAPNIDYAAVLTPSYFAQQMDDAALEQYYVAIAERSPIPVVIYAAPKFANGVRPSATLVRALSFHSNIAGIKDTTGNMMDEYLEAARDSQAFSVLSGSINTLERCLNGGGAGGILSIANYAPERCANVTRLFGEGHRNEAVEELAELQSAAAGTSAPYSVAGVKACMNACGYAAGWPRPPLREVSGEQLKRLVLSLDERGLLRSASSNS